MRFHFISLTFDNVPLRDYVIKVIYDELTKILGEEETRYIPEKGKQIRVLEHLASALHATGITDITVHVKNAELSKASIPIIGPGIEFYLDLLQKHKEIYDDKPSKTICAEKAFSFSDNDDDEEIKSLVKIEPSDTLEILIPSAKHPDVDSPNEKKAYMEDFYKQADQHKSARGLGRVNHPAVYRLWQIARLLGYKGICKETYVPIGLHDTSETIVEKMQPKYQKTRNEHSYHTAVCDFPGELLAVITALGANIIKAKFTLKNTNHFTRIEALKHFVKNGIFQLENR